MKEFAASGFFVLRTPLLPIQEFLGLSDGLRLPQALHESGDIVSAAAADRILVRSRLQQMVARPEVEEALWLASPEFLESLSFWKRQPESEHGQKLERSLYRYVARMTSRPTPFGLFAGCTLGKIGSKTQLQIGPHNAYWRRSRLDMEYLCNLADKISCDPLLRRQISFRPNTSLYFSAGKYHHAQGYFADERRCYRLIATDYTPYLAATLERAAHGATPATLASALVQDDPQISMEEADAYIRQLIESQLLVSDLTPAITGPEPIDDMLMQLERAGAPAIQARLSIIANSLRQLDQCGLGNHVKGYQQIVNTASQLPAELIVEHFVQVDMMKPAASLSLDQRLLHSILRALEALHSIMPTPQNDRFQQFKADFSERYQDQQVPLLLALDEELGIGFEPKDSPGTMVEPLIEDLNFSGEEEKTRPAVTRQELVLLRKVQDAAEQKRTILELDSALLESLRVEKTLPLPDAFAIMGHLLESRDGAGAKFYLQSASGPSGALLLGRFCHADDQLTECIEAHLRAEEQARSADNVVFAEIAHLPEGRIGNVLYRPMLRKYEIPFLATSRAPAGRQIPVSDLVVAIENDRVVLRSQRLGCEVVPRLTSAHGFEHVRNLKIYKFLCALQAQGVSGAIAWNWGILEHSPFLPRVVYPPQGAQNHHASGTPLCDSIVLSPARWRMDKEEIGQLTGHPGPERLRRVHEWRAQKRIPRFVLLAEADNQLLIDFDNVLSVEMLLEYIRKRERVALVEMLPGPERLSVHGPEGDFTHEVVIPFIRVKDHARKTASAPPIFRAALDSLQRDFLPGSEWLYAKIYSSPSQLDRLLLEHIGPLTEKIISARQADSWFFIRYGDPQWHLRLRFHGDPETLTAHVLTQLSQCLERQQKAGKLWRMQLDTYQREVERYGGGAGILFAERLFHLDSELALKLLSAISDRLGSKLRWRLAFASADALLCSLGFNFVARRQLVNLLGKSQEKNFAVNQRYRKQLSERFRQERQTLERLLGPAEGCSEFPAGIEAILERFTGEIKAIRTQLEEAEKAGTLTKPLTELAGNYLHMHLNRMFRSVPNAQEMVLYDFLGRTYDSMLARRSATRK